MRDVEQVMRFYLISKRINCRTIKSLMDRPEWSPLLKLCVERLKTYKEFGIKRCKEIKKEIREKRFKFKYNPFERMEESTRVKASLKYLRECGYIVTKKH